MLKTTCHPLNSETARSMYSTGWGMLAAPYLMAASGDVNVVALVSILAVLRWNPCRVWARRRDVRETRVLRWLRDGERRPLAFWGAGGDGMRKRSASRRKGPERILVFPESRVPGEGGRADQKVVLKFGVGKDKMRQNSSRGNDGHHQISGFHPSPGVPGGQRAAMLPCTIADRPALNSGSIACGPHVGATYAPVSPTFITLSSEAQ